MAYNKYNSEQLTTLLPKDLAYEVRTDANNNSRTISKQIAYIIKKYYEESDNFDDTKHCK